MTYSLNQEHHGVELCFEAKPEADTLNALRSNGLRWNNFKKCWYTKQTDESIQFAKDLSEGIEPEVTQTAEAPKTAAYYKKVSDYISIETYEKRLSAILDSRNNGREQYKDATIRECLKDYSSDNEYRNLTREIRQTIVMKSIGMKCDRMELKYQAVWGELPTIKGLKPGKKYSAMWGYDQTQITTAVCYGKAFGLDVLVTGGFGSGEVLLKRIDKNGHFSESCMHFSPNTYTDEYISKTNTEAIYNGH